MQNHWRRNVAFFITGQLISLFGSMLVQYAITWYITLETQSGLMMTIAILCGFIPALLLTPFAGVWVDRFDRRKLIVVADASIALVTVITAIVFAAGFRAIWLLFIVSALRSLGGAVHSPTVGAVYPQLVPQDKLMRVQGIASGVQSAMNIVAPIAGASLLAFTSLEVIFSIDVLTALLAISSILFLVKIPRPAKREGTGKIDYLADMKLGLRYVREHHFLIPFFVFTGSVLFFIAPVAFLTPLQVVRDFGEEIWRLSAIEIAFSGGMAIGGFLVAVWNGFRNRIVTMIYALLVMAAVTIGLGVIETFWIYLALMVVIGVSLPFYNTPAIVMIQEKVDPAFMGRVLAVMGMITGSAMQLGLVAFGPLADVVAIDWLLVGSGVVLLALSALTLANRKLVASGVAPVKTAPPPVPAQG